MRLFLFTCAIIVIVVNLEDRDCRRGLTMLLELFLSDAPTTDALRWRRLSRRVS